MSLQDIKERCNRIMGSLILTESSSESRDKVPVYVVVVYTKSSFGRVIKAYTRGPYTHASIGLDSKLDKLYSFNLIKDKNVNGFSIESISDYITDNEDARMTVFVVFVKKSLKQKLKETLDWFIDHINETKYSLLNTFTVAFQIPFDRGTKMICSQFVDKMLKLINVDVTGKKSSKVFPNDIYRSKSNKLFKVFEGRVDKYDKKKADKNTKEILKSDALDDGNNTYVQEGNFIIVENASLYEDDWIEI